MPPPYVIAMDPADRAVLVNWVRAARATGQDG
jgi:hypothetical protein